MPRFEAGNGQPELFASRSYAEVRIAFSRRYAMVFVFYGTGGETRGYNQIDVPRRTRELSKPKPIFKPNSNRATLLSDGGATALDR